MKPQDYIYQAQRKRYESFVNQDPENEEFDTIFDFDGKKLYTTKYMLTTSSETFKAMFALRWNKDNNNDGNEAIPIQKYTFEDFFQFLCFLYSGECLLTLDNIRAEIDLAEYYAVEEFKDLCDKFVSKIPFTSHTVFGYVELACDYSLKKTQRSLRTFITGNLKNLLKADEFLNAKVGVVEFISTVRYPYDPKETLFKAVYEWSRHQAVGKDGANILPDTTVNECIKEKMETLLPHFKFAEMKMKFLLEFVVKKCGYIFTYEQLGNILMQSYKAYPKTRMLTPDMLMSSSESEEEDVVVLNAPVQGYFERPPHNPAASILLAQNLLQSSDED